MTSSFEIELHAFALHDLGLHDLHVFGRISFGLHDRHVFDICVGLHELHVLLA